jgi:hypothetical protein
VTLRHWLTPTLALFSACATVAILDVTASGAAAAKAAAPTANATPNADAGADARSTADAAPSDAAPSDAAPATTDSGSDSGTTNAGTADGGNIDSDAGPDVAPSCPRNCAKPPDSQQTIQSTQKCAALALACRDDAKQKLDAAKTELTSAGAPGTDGGTPDASQLQRAAKEYAQAETRFIVADQVYTRAQDTVDQLQERYDRAIAWHTGVGVEFRLAGAAGGRGVWSLGAPLVLRSSPIFELQLVPSFESVSATHTQTVQEDRRAYEAVRGRLAFDADGTAVYFGIGTAVRAKHASESAVLLPIGLRYRFGQERERSPQFFSDLALQMEPWIYLDHRDTSVFFGVAWTLGFDFGQLGNDGDQYLDETNPSAMPAADGSGSRGCSNARN